jgi:hypothetical protein
MPVKPGYSKKVKSILVYERKILRKVFGPSTENDSWQIKINQELYQLINYKNTSIINFICAQRLSWLGQVEPMPTKYKTSGQTGNTMGG